jgi:flagellar assembly factor FliW
VILEKTRFGTIEINDDKIVTMIKSMPGFSGRKRFVILNREETHPFLWFQSIDDPPLAFAILNPYMLIPDYSVDLVPELKEISWQADAGQLTVFVLVNASSGVPDKMTANLMAPLVVNTDRFEALQVIMPDSGYSHRHPLFSNEKSVKSNR